MARKSTANGFLTEEESTRIEQAIAEVELTTSAEVKVVVLRYCWDDIYVKAARIFSKFRLDKTELRNCVLVMLVVTNQEYLIYGDEGIHEKVGDGFWDDVRDEMLTHFVCDHFGDGLVHAVHRVGEKLADYFPYQTDDVDEIPNEVIFED